MCVSHGAGHMLRPPAHTCPPRKLASSLKKSIILTFPSLTFYQAGKCPNPATEIRSGFNVSTHQPMLSRQIYIKKQSDWLEGKEMINLTSANILSLARWYSSSRSSIDLLLLSSFNLIRIWKHKHLLLDVLLFGTFIRQYTNLGHCMIAKALSPPLTKLSSLSMLELSLFKM